MKIVRKMFLLYLTFMCLPVFANNFPQGFVYLNKIDPSIQQDMRYAGHHNFIGRPIKGYDAGECILTKEAATRGSTVDLTIITLPDMKEIDMGTNWDFMDERSHGDNKENNRMQRYQRISDRQAWQAVRKSFPVFIEKNGMAPGGIEKRGCT